MYQDPSVASADAPTSQPAAAAVDRPRDDVNLRLDTGSIPAMVGRLRDLDEDQLARVVLAVGYAGAIAAAFAQVDEIEAYVASLSDSTR